MGPQTGPALLWRPHHLLPLIDRSARSRRLRLEMASEKPHPALAPSQSPGDGSRLIASAAGLEPRLISGLKSRPGLNLTIKLRQLDTPKSGQHRGFDESEMRYNGCQLLKSALPVPDFSFKQPLVLVVELFAI
jgi:hypothetical protein